MKHIIAIISFLLASACVKLEIGNAVSDTVDASKEIYQTIKRKRNGEEERQYMHSVPLSAGHSDLAGIRKCNEQIRQIIVDSGYLIKDVLSESSKIQQENDNRSVVCTLVVVVKKADT